MSERALVVNEAERGTLLAAGPDAVVWLNGLLTCDVAAVDAEHGVYGLLLSKQGKIQSDFTVLRGPDGLLLSVAPGMAPSLLATLDRFLVMEDASISDVSADWAWVHFHGPSAAESAERAAAALGGVSTRVAWSDSEGAALALPRARAAELDRFLRAQGGGLAHPEEWEAFRVEHALARFGADFGDDDNPHEAGLDRRAVSWQKGCYLGQEVVCMQDMRGKLKRRLVVLALDDADAPPPAPGAKVTAGGAEVGEVTSSARGKSGSRALARMRSPYFEGTEALAVGAHAARVEKAG